MSGACLLLAASLLAAEPLPGTKPLPDDGDLAGRMVDGIHKYLNRETAAAPGKRKALWKWDHAELTAPPKKEPPARAQLRRFLGVVEERVGGELEYVSQVGRPSLVAEGAGYTVHAVRWPVLPGVDAEGLLLEPKGKPRGCVVALPDADWTPEMLVGLAPGVPKEGQFARHLAENGCRVLVPTLIDRKDTWAGNPKVRLTNQPHREFVYRMAYQNGRHIIGYEIQKVLAAVDWFTRDRDHPPVGVAGHGEGGLLALYAQALDWRIKATLVSGHFGPRERLWQEPIYRNVWGLLREFGDAEVASMRNAISGQGDRGLFLEHCKGPEVSGPPAPRDGRQGAAPGGLVTPEYEEVERENNRITGHHLGTLTKTPSGVARTDIPITYFYRHLIGDDNAAAIRIRGTDPPADRRKGFDPAARQKRQLDQLVAFTQKLTRDSEQRRQEFFWSKLDLSSVEKYEKSAQPFREYLWKEVLGQLPAPTLPATPRTRLAYDEPKWKGYDVRLDLYPDVFAYGVLLVPKDLKPGEKRPVVVCQHGLEGRPRDVVDPRVKSVYHAFGAQLADRGYIVYAPQNPYIGGNTFRQINRKANPLGLTMYSFILRQHERTLDWLAGLPFVEGERIGYYGLSYGGETAVRVPPLLPRYKLSICSACFNHFPWKTCTLDFAASYMLVNTYEIFDFNLNNTFSHAEMAALMAPRPFMVERGHGDGVGLDEWVDYEYAKVRRLYARLGIPERTAIEFFRGGHEINGKGTFAFLEKHLGRPR